MDYEKKYKEALEKAKEFYALCEKCGAKDTVDFLEDSFPELKESEDEKVEKAIFGMVYDSDNELWSSYDVSKSDVLAWLEKQGELVNSLSKGLDNAHERIDELIQKNNELCINLEKQGEEKISDKTETMKHGYITTNPEFFQWIYDRLKYVYNENPNVDYMLSLKERIEDMQKFADKIKPKFKVDDWIIDNKNRVGIIVRILDGHYIISFDGREVQIPFEWEGKLFRKWTIQDAKDGDVLVASDGSLFILAKVKDNSAYYHFSLWKNGSKEISDGNHSLENAKGCHPATKEQRTELFLKMHEAGYEWDAEKKELKKIEDEEYNGEDYGIDSLYHAQRILEKTLGSVDGYQTDDGILSHKCAITAVKKLYEQKPAWSEEDENNIDTIISVYHPSPKIVNWLKSLKQRYTWKPSDEQIEILNMVLTNESMDDNIARILRELREQLKKLMKM